MTLNERIADWQKRLNAQPAVWAVVDSDGGVSNLYESKEAALLEVKWRKEHRAGPSSVTPLPIHSLALSRERWVESFTPAEAPHE